MTSLAPVRGHHLQRALVWLLIKVACGLSWKNVEGLGAALGSLMYRLRIRKSVAMTNLDIVFGDRKTRAEKEAIYKASLINLCRHLLNYPRLARMDDAFWRESFPIENEELLRDAYNRGKGVIFTGGHIGEWEIATGRIGMAGYPISIVAKRMHNPVVENLIVESRLAMNLGTVAHRDSMQRVMEGLRNGEGVTMAVDQNMKRSQGVFVNWLGHVASTVRSNAWVVKQTGAPVIVGYAYRIGTGRFKLVITEEVPWEPHPEDPERELLINTQNQVRAVEKVIYEHPEIWHWIHRRYKTQPEGAPNPYAE
ncbi:MAG: lysophospholipid acyltransferase family protein [Myxococcales bacterium]|nr:lysophospholipid acyltransferase family protein [Myxococcales bacterium]